MKCERIKSQDPSKNYRYRFPGLRYPRKIETVASDTFFLQLNHHVVIIVHNSLWELYQIGGFYNRWRRKIKIVLSWKITQGKCEFHQCQRRTIYNVNRWEMDKYMPKILYLSNQHRNPFSMRKSCRAKYWKTRINGYKCHEGVWCPTERKRLGPEMVCRCAKYCFFLKIQCEVSTWN